MWWELEVGHPTVQSLVRLHGSLAQYWWQMVITFDSSRIRVKLECYLYAGSASPFFGGKNKMLLVHLLVLVVVFCGGLANNVTYTCDTNPYVNGCSVPARMRNYRRAFIIACNRHDICYSCKLHIFIVTLVETGMHLYVFIMPTILMDFLTLNSDKVIQYRNVHDCRKSQFIIF